MNALDKVFRIIPKCLMKDFVFDKLTAVDKKVPIYEDKYYHEGFWDDIFENDLVWCEDFYNWSGREYSAKDICIMINFLSKNDYLSFVDMGEIDPEWIVGHTIHQIIRYEINEEFEEWCKEKLGTDDGEEEEEEEEEGEGEEEKKVVEVEVEDDNDPFPGYFGVEFIENTDFLQNETGRIYKINEDKTLTFVGRRCDDRIEFLPAYEHLKSQIIYS